jgi:hypothetical protein
MLLTTSIISPSTAAALLANSWCSGRPAAASRNMAKTTMAPTTVKAAAIVVLMVVTKAIATKVATQGGSTFQMNMFSIVYTAFEVAVMRLVNMPGSRSAK